MTNSAVMLTIFEDLEERSPGGKIGHLATRAKEEETGRDRGFYPC
jgi:hypothetical protein